MKECSKKRLGMRGLADSRDHSGRVWDEEGETGGRLDQLRDFVVS